MMSVSCRGNTSLSDAAVELVPGTVIDFCLVHSLVPYVPVIVTVSSMRCCCIFHVSAVLVPQRLPPEVLSGTCYLEDVAPFIYRH